MNNRCCYTLIPEIETLLTGQTPAPIYGLISVDTLKLDDHSRLTLARKFKNAFHIDIGDTLAVYQGAKADELFLNIQSKGEVTERWRLSQLVKNDDPVSKDEFGSFQMDGKVDTSFNPKDSLKLTMQNIIVKSILHQENLLLILW